MGTMSIRKLHTLGTIDHNDTVSFGKLKIEIMGPSGTWRLVKGLTFIGADRYQVETWNGDMFLVNGFDIARETKGRSNEHI